MFPVQSGQVRLDQQPVPLHGTGGRCGHGQDRGGAGEHTHTLSESVISDLFCLCPVVKHLRCFPWNISCTITHFKVPTPSERRVKNRFETSVKYGGRLQEVSWGFVFQCFTVHSLFPGGVNWNDLWRREGDFFFWLSWLFSQVFLWKEAQSLSQGDSYWLGLRTGGGDEGWQWSDGSRVEKGPEWVMIGRRRRRRRRRRVERRLLRWRASRCWSPGHLRWY